jgi:uncharacterized protein YjbI with pentapeptide repeats
MKTIKPQVLSLLTRPFEYTREFWLGCAVIAAFPTSDPPVLMKEAALWPFLSEELPPDQSLDAAIPKATPEFLAVAHCHAPNGTPAPLLRTGIQLGQTIKMLDVHGDRVIDREANKVTTGEPFTRMPLDWARAFGGPDFPDNPLGKGVVPLPGTNGTLIPVQNIINPRLGRDGARVPTGYGPVDQMWPARASRVGTHDDAWLKHDFPGFARDIDWNFFNISQSDQWLRDPLRGDEAFAFKNLHPTKPLLKGRLPGIAPRLFVTRKNEPDSFEEVPLTLTTVWFFPHRERMVLIHHGRARLSEEDGSDIERVVVGADRLDALRPEDDFRRVMDARGDRKKGAMLALRDQDLVPGEWLGDANAPPSPAPPLAIARSRRQLERQRDALIENLKARGMDPAKFAIPEIPPPTPPPTLEELPAFAEAALADAEAAKARALADVETRRADAAKRLAASGLSPDEIEQRLNPTPKGPPSFSAAATIESLQSQIRGRRALGQLSLDLEAQLSSPAFLGSLAKAEAEARNGYRQIAHMQAPADSQPADRNADIRAMIARDTAEARALYDLHGADLSDLDLSGLDLSGICLDGADLSGTSLAGANLTNAVLAHATLTGCRFDGAILDGANLGATKMEGTTLTGASLKRAILAKADLTGAVFTNAVLEEADLSEAILGQADFSGIRAAGLLALKLDLNGFRAPGADLFKAKFIECHMQGCDLSGARLDRAVFLSCDLAGGRLAQTSLRKAVFVKGCSLLAARLTGSDLTGANLRETLLHGANLNDATLIGADLSGANLANALLTNVRARGCRAIAADLHLADMRLGDFSFADLSRSDLRGARLTGMSVYAANMARTKLDETTHKGGIFRSKMRYLPVWEPPPKDAP